MMHAIVLLHRWLGIAFCLLFAMWFASGIVMHFVPFPSLTEAERFAGLDAGRSAERSRMTVADAVAASEIADATRVRLVQRSDGPVYVVSGRSRVRAVHASDGRNASVTSADVADVSRGSCPATRARCRAGGVVGSRIMINGAYPTASIDTGRCIASLYGDAGTELYVSSRHRRSRAGHDPQRARVELGRQRAALDLSDDLEEQLVAWDHGVVAVAGGFYRRDLGAVLGIIRIED